MKIVLLGYPNRPGVEQTAALLKPQIQSVAQIVCSDFTGTADLSKLEADAVVVLGGDGSLFRAVSQMGERQLPLIAVNLGRLGFLADLTVDELIPLLRELKDNPLPIVNLMMYRCRVIRNGKTILTHHGVNEAAILTGAPFSIMEIKLHVDEELVTTFSCDGLIIATPVGSTAHSLSAGGPILHKMLQAFVVCPVAAHTLTNRPIVESADRVFVVEVVQPLQQTSVVADGQVIHRLESGDQVEIQRSSRSVLLINPPHRSYYKTLREKLGWSGQPIYRR